MPVLRATSAPRRTAVGAAAIRRARPRPPLPGERAAATSTATRRVSAPNAHPLTEGRLERLFGGGLPDAIGGNEQPAVRALEAAEASFGALDRLGVERLPAVRAHELSRCGRTRIGHGKRLFPIRPPRNLASCAR